MITNACVRVCGGCSMLCGTYGKKELFFISLEEFHKAVGAILVSQHRSRRYEVPAIMLYGGEATLHPRFQEILDACEQYGEPGADYIAFSLWSCSAERCNRFQIPKNVNVCISEKMADPEWSTSFVAALVSPMDVLKHEDKSYYWKLAQKWCVPWNQCSKIIYNGKAYFCERAGPLEHHMGTSHGWEVDPTKDPWDRTDDEIADQAKHFCYRCGHCMGHEVTQDTSSPYVVSPTNHDLLDRPSFRHRLPVLLGITEEEKKKARDTINKDSMKLL